MIKPNAFRPGGLNNSFGTVYRFTRHQAFRLLIFNLLGKMVFETNDVTKGWDGNYLGESIRKQGTVSVVY